ncbi:MAG: alpha/beta hydrolase [Alphaproteobacteria bacterium]|nr:alpha/beta hydrolase [Alphaproteobacteria bacterium]
MAPQAIHTRELQWSWQGRALTLGVDEAGDGPPVLLLPALSSISTRREMHPLMAALAPGFRLIAPDWPGFGDRPRPAINWTPEALSAFLEHLVVQDLPALHATVAAGHAAAYALHLAAQRPGVLGGRLALLAPTWRGPLPTMAGGDRRLFHAIRRAVALPVAGPLLYRLNVNRFVVRMMVAGHVYSEADTLAGERLRQKQDVIRAAGARFGSAGFVTGGLDRLGSRRAFVDLARRVAQPVLVAYGAGTPPKSRAEMAALAELPNVRAWIAPRGKLGFYEEFGAELAPTLSAFLSDAAPASAATVKLP